MILDKQFSDEERYAVYTVHGEKCYLHGEPIDLFSMEVDHIIPERLLKHPAELSSVLAQFGLPPDFNLQSFANWLPACGPCNTRKRAHVFTPSPLIQLHLQIARDKAQQAAELASKRINSRVAARAWNTIKRADNGGTLSEELLNAILEFASFHAPKREPEVAELPMYLTPLIEVISESGHTRIVKGPYGIGGGTTRPDAHTSFFCGSCGHSAWNGARCVVCGEMSDD
jgi:5-methylcytosine-specific restriction endonuclease McrA